MIRQSILTNQIPRAQAVLRKQGCPETRLSALRMKGLCMVLSCLQRRDLQTADTLLINMVRTPQCHCCLLISMGFAVYVVHVLTRRAP